MLDHQVGDKVIHAHYGLGEIVRLDKKFIHGRWMLCYVVRIRDLTIWVAADQPDKSSLRKPTPKSDFEKLFTILKSPGGSLPIDRNERKTELTQRIRDGKLASICSVIRDLDQYGRTKKFNDNDKSIMERAENFLISEWMYSRSVSKVQAKEELTRLLG
jgi:RNA polymerase-interacting CarD/CdnL/TRCF family regulator